MRGTREAELGRGVGGAFADLPFSRGTGHQAVRGTTYGRHQYNMRFHILCILYTECENALYMVTLDML